MIVVGEAKAETLTTFVPAEVEAVELLMREEGMLRRYPRDGAK